MVNAIMKHKCSPNNINVLAVFSLLGGVAVIASLLPNFRNTKSRISLQNDHI